MAGDGGPGPIRSAEGHADGSAGPSEDKDQEHPASPPAAPGEASEHADGAGAEVAGAEVSGSSGQGSGAGQTQDDEGQTDLPAGAGEEGAADQSGSVPQGLTEPEPMRQAAFVDVGLELPSTSPTVVLREIDAPMRELRVTIAQAEGVAIAHAWRGIPRPTPLTHDLLTSILQRFGLQVDAVRITGVDGPVFHAELALSGPGGSHTVECRPSDALAVALRQPLPVPIMVAEEVLLTAGRVPGA